MRPGPLVIALTSAWLATNAAAQVVSDIVPGGAVSVQLSSDTVEIGDVIELRIELEVPAGRIAYFPDSLASTSGFESRGPVEWHAERRTDGGSIVSLTYAAFAFQFGVRATPEFEIMTGPAPSRDENSGPTAVEPVGSWRTIEEPDVAAALVRFIVPSQHVMVTSVVLLQNISQGLAPRPADDVVGSSWKWTSLLWALAFGGVLTWVLAATGRDWLAARAAARGDVGTVALDPIEAARLAALAELDRLLGLGLPEKGFVDEFYTRSSTTIRGYVERLDPSWGPAITSTELMQKLEKRANGRAVPDLSREMYLAETVKFGRLRPDPATAKKHWTTLRTWVSGSAEAGSGDDPGDDS